MTIVTKSRTVHAVATTATYFYGVNEKNQTVAVSPANLRGLVYVADAPFYAKGDGVTDDTEAIQAAIDANPGKVIVGCDGTSVVSTTLTVTGGSTCLDRFKLRQVTPDIDTLVFKPTTAGTTADFLNFPELRNSTITHGSAVYGTHTSGAGVRFLQCNGYKLFNCTINGAFEGVVVQGGQFGSLKSFQIFASQGSYAGDGTALLHFRQAPYASSFQPMYTCEVEDYRLSATKLRDTCIRVSNADGLQFGAGYVAFGKNSLMMVKAERADSYVAGLSLQSVYLDCVNTSTGTINGIDIPDDGFAGTYVYHLTVGTGCLLGNGSGVGVLSRHPRVSLLQIQGGAVVQNMTGYGVDVEGSTSTTVNIGGSAFRSNAGGAIRLSAGAALTIVGNTFHNNTTQNIKLEGAWSSGTIAGNVGSTATAELVNTATFSNGLRLSANASPYTGTSVWTHPASVTASLNFGSLAAGAAENLTIAVPGAAVGDLVIGSLSGGSNVLDVGGGCQLLFTYGVTATDTVNVKAFNIGTGTGDAASQTFKVAIVR